MSAAVLRRGPWLALALTLLSFACGSTSALEFDRAAIGDGEWWRLVTAHFVHYNAAHSVGDILAFLLWAGLIESRSRRLLAVAVLLSAIVVGAGILIFCAGVARYRGLSGIDVALAVVVLAVMAASPVVRAVPHARSALVLISILLMMKTLYELAVGAAILAPDLGVGVRLLPAAHVLGAAAGILVCWFSFERTAIDPSPR